MEKRILGNVAQYEKEEGNSCTESHRSLCDSLSLALYDHIVNCVNFPYCFSLTTFNTVGLGGLMWPFCSSIVIIIFPYFGHSSIKKYLLSHYHVLIIVLGCRYIIVNKIVKNPSTKKLFFSN